jgi:hypothetical protein
MKSHSLHNKVLLTHNKKKKKFKESLEDYKQPTSIKKMNCKTDNKKYKTKK